MSFPSTCVHVHVRVQVRVFTTVHGHGHGCVPALQYMGVIRMARRPATDLVEDSTQCCLLELTLTLTLALTLTLTAPLTPTLTQL